MALMGKTITCTLTKTDLTTNLADSCKFLSARTIVVKRNSVDASTTSSNKFVLKLTGISSPNYVPEAVKNKIEVLLFNSYTPLESPGKNV
jgi:hypothetical protein